MSTGKVPVPDGQFPDTPELELALFRAAQKAVDDVLGEGEYVRINGFDPSKGETHK
jgi:hypothetical protein